MTDHEDRVFALLLRLAKRHSRDRIVYPGSRR